MKNSRIVKKDCSKCLYKIKRAGKHCTKYTVKQLGDHCDFYLKK